MKQDQNPWLVVDLQNDEPGCQTIDSVSRIEQIKLSHDVAWLRQVLAWRDNQITVRQAAERRLRVLSRKAVGV